MFTDARVFQDSVIFAILLHVIDDILKIGYKFDVLAEIHSDKALIVHFLDSNFSWKLVWIIG